jgi:hypothetical protein
VVQAKYLSSVSPIRDRDRDRSYFLAIALDGENYQSRRTEFCIREHIDEN